LSRHFWHISLCRHFQFPHVGHTKYGFLSGLNSCLPLTTLLGVTYPVLDLRHSLQEGLSPSFVEDILWKSDGDFSWSHVAHNFILPIVYHASVRYERIERSSRHWQCPIISIIRIPHGALNRSRTRQARVETSMPVLR
jgi:hypothetical protein